MDMKQQIKEVVRAFGDDLLNAFEAGKREGKIEAYRDAVETCPDAYDHFQDGLRRKAAALEKDRP